MEHLGRAQKTWTDSEQQVDSALTAHRLRNYFIDGYSTYSKAFYPDVEPWAPDAGLARRLCGYLQFRLEHSRGASGGKVMAQTVRWWQEMLVGGVVREIGDADTVLPLLRGKRADHHDGLVHRLRMFAVELAVSNNLERHGKDGKFYGRSELTLMLLVLEERMNNSPFTVPSSMQTQVLILLSFYSDLRPSSLVRAEVGQRTVLRIQDIKIVKRGRFFFTAEITIKNLKGFAGALDAAHRQTWIIHSVTKAHEAFFYLTAVMIPCLISRGVVVDTTMNKPVPDIETFLASSSSTFECQGSGPLFVAGRAGTGKLEEGVPLRGANMAAIIGAVCVKAGLPRVGGYAFRHEVGNRMTIMLGAEAAKGPKQA
ncbi:hypothetical protein CF319_g8749 [Tilletia indica]|nr:hypothetical protein CF319_g8749 [Tilletia indica]